MRSACWASCRGRRRCAFPLRPLGCDTALPPLNSEVHPPSQMGAQLQILELVDIERRTIGALDTAMAPVIMQRPALRMVLKIAKSVSPAAP